MMYIDDSRYLVVTFQLLQGVVTQLSQTPELEMSHFDIHSP